MKRAALAVLAAGLAGLTLPAAQASADESALGGFVAKAIGTPIRIEIHEPLIPIPSDPQLELDVAYTKAIAQTGPGGKGRASWLWPGDPVGEGAKTFVEQLGLPPQLGENGYPVQVNAEYPGDNTSVSDEPFPGMVMRSSADAQATVAKAGFSSTGDLEDGDAKAAGDGGSSTPGAPGLPALPTAPSPAASGAGAEGDPGTPGLGALAAVVSADGVSSVSKTSYGTDTIVASAVTRIGGLKLLGGVITADSVKVLSRTSSTLTKSTSVNDVTVSGLEVNGVPFGLTKDGAVVAGQSQAVPGAPDPAAQALAELGVSFALPTATKTESGGSGQQEVRGLQVSIDFSKLRNRFDSGPVDDLIAQLPDDLGELKAALGATTQARPTVVVVLGAVTTEASTVAPIDYEPPATTPSDETPAASGPSGSAPAGTVGGPVAAAPADLPPPAAVGDISGPVPTTDVAVQPTGAGLPPLGSVPGALVVGGLVLASALGWWMQKMGGLVLGGAAACSHGLASGVPDLRKA